MLGALITAVALVGLLDSLYFVLVTYGFMRPDPRWLPPVCRMDERSCASVIDTPYARVLGLPNAVYGLGWFVVAAAAGLVHAFTGDIPLCWLLVAVAAGTVALSAYLFWSLVARLKVRCVLCFAGHAINAALVGLLWFACV